MELMSEFEYTKPTMENHIDEIPSFARAQIDRQNLPEICD